MMNPKSIVDGLGHPRVLVVGDLMLDRYIWGNSDRISPEAPVLVLNAVDREVRPGGAAGAASFLECLEAEVQVAGVVGDDPEGRVLTRILNEAGISSEMIVRDPNRHTTAKERYMGYAANRTPYQLLRVDYESVEPINSEFEDRLLAGIERELADCEVVLISDYDKGVCTPRLLRAVIQQARERQLPVVVDPSFTSDLAHYQGATILKPNRREAARAAGFAIETPQDAIRAARQLQQQCKVESVLITLDRDGIVLVDREGVSEHFATQARSVCDITAAGDMVLAVVGFGTACGVDLRETVQLANCAAGLQVERVGATSLRRGDLQREFTRRNHAVIDKQVTLDQMTELAESYRVENRRVVFTNGCFDLIHAGHTSYLQQAAALGDVLIVAINGDESIATLKGSDRPLIPACQRAALLSSLACVDHLLIFDDLTPHRLLRAIRPDVLVKGGTYTTDEVVGREIVTEYGGRVVVTEAMEGLSTTNLIEQVRSLSSPATRRASFEMLEH